MVLFGTVQTAVFWNCSDSVVFLVFGVITLPWPLFTCVLLLSNLALSSLSCEKLVFLFSKTLNRSVGYLFQHLARAFSFICNDAEKECRFYAFF